jgi:hypothetical protein
MIEIEGSSVTYSVKISDKTLWDQFTGAYLSNHKVTRTGDSWYHFTMSRWTFDHSGFEFFSEDDQAALLALTTDYYHFHWYDPKPDARRAKTFEKRFKKSKER